MCVRVFHVFCPTFFCMNEALIVDGKAGRAEGKRKTPNSSLDRGLENWTVRMSGHPRVKYNILRYNIWTV